MGYQAAVSGWQWQSRWLIALSFIRDSRNAASRSQHLEGSHQTENSHDRVPPGRSRKYSPSASERELSIAQRTPHVHLGCADVVDLRCRSVRPHASGHMSDHFPIRKPETEGEKSLDPVRRCRPADSRPSPPSPPQMTSSTSSSQRPSGRPPRYEQKHPRHTPRAELSPVGRSSTKTLK